MHTEMYEEEVTSVEEGHDVERVTAVRSDFVKDTKSTMEKPAKEIHESRDIGRPTVDCQFVKPSRRWRVKGRDNEKGEVAYVKEGQDVERVTASRSDVAKDTMSTMVIPWKRWTSPTSAS